MRAMRDPERDMLAPLLQAEMKEKLDELPEHFRLAIVLSDIEGMSYKEIADIMECPVGTVMSRLHRARKQLQGSLQKHAVELGIIEDDDGDIEEPIPLEAFRARKALKS